MSNLVPLPEHEQKELQHQKATERPEGPFFNPSEYPELHAVPDVPDFSLEDIASRIEVDKFVQDSASIVRIGRQQRLRQALHIYGDLTGFEITPKERDKHLQKTNSHLSSVITVNGLKMKREEAVDVHAAEDQVCIIKQEQGELMPLLIQAIGMKTSGEFGVKDFNELRSDLLRLVYWEDIKKTMALELSIKKKVGPGLMSLLTRILP